ncbi:hypothetical protein C8A00DRAFT_30895 [Chaetomidium leptoderma]|uniref:Uncharacterized protein n=1 Tax=Chaetomidium leptoderma TaxID=669021 RepID=A0AAN6ZY13_9PEZI|nr:hypothetical protein C8A00DRAFT_30895 [Chaetomidium leptoderma]
MAAVMNPPPTFTFPFSVPNTEESSSQIFNELARDGRPVPHRELITGFDRDGGAALMAVNGSMPYYIHGLDHPASKTPHTLVIFTFHIANRLRGNGSSTNPKRVRSVHITVTFDAHGPRGDAAADRARSGGRTTNTTAWDPEVVGLAPHGTALYNRTPHTVSTTHAVELGLEVGLPGGVSVGPKYNYTRADSGAQRVDAVRVVGDRIFGPGSRSRANGVRWDLFENEAAKGGVPSFLRAAVLLKRQPGDNGQFLGTVKVESCVSGLRDMRESWWRLMGSIPRDDPLVFDPREPNRAGEYKRFTDRLGEVALDKVAAVVAVGDDEKEVGK